MRKTTIAALTALMMIAAIPAAFAKGPPESVFEEKGVVVGETFQGTWMCEDDGFVGNHCLNAKSKGKTLNIKVFDPRGPQESASADPAADSRPCPHDDGGSGPFGTDPEGGDGTWWNYMYDDIPNDGNDPDGPLYVCHHNGSQ